MKPETKTATNTDRNTNSQKSRKTNNNTESQNQPTTRRMNNDQFPQTYQEKIDNANDCETYDDNNRVTNYYGCGYGEDDELCMRASQLEVQGGTVQDVRMLLPWRNQNRQLGWPSNVEYLSDNSQGSKLTNVAGGNEMAASGQMQQGISSGIPGMGSGIAVGASGMMEARPTQQNSGGRPKQRAAKSVLPTESGPRKLPHKTAGGPAPPGHLHHGNWGTENQHSSSHGTRTNQSSAVANHGPPSQPTPSRGTTTNQSIMSLPDGTIYWVDGHHTVWFRHPRLPFLAPHHLRTHEGETTRYYNLEGSNPSNLQPYGVYLFPNGEIYTLVPYQPSGYINQGHGYLQSFTTGVINAPNITNVAQASNATQTNNIELAGGTGNRHGNTSTVEGGNQRTGDSATSRDQSVTSPLSVGGNQARTSTQRVHQQTTQMEITGHSTASAGNNHSGAAAGSSGYHPELRGTANHPFMVDIFETQGISAAIAGNIPSGAAAGSSGSVADARGTAHRPSSGNLAAASPQAHQRTNNQASPPLSNTTMTMTSPQVTNADFRNWMNSGSSREIRTTPMHNRRQQNANQPNSRKRQLDYEDYSSDPPSSGKKSGDHDREDGEGNGGGDYAI